MIYLSLISILHSPALIHATLIHSFCLKGILAHSLTHSTADSLILSERYPCSLTVAHDSLILSDRLSLLLSDRFSTFFSAHQNGRTFRNAQQLARRQPKYRIDPCLPAALLPHLSTTSAPLSFMAHWYSTSCSVSQTPPSAVAAHSCANSAVMHAAATTAAFSLILCLPAAKHQNVDAMSYLPTAVGGWPFHLK